MRTIFLLLCILSVTVATRAQSKNFDKFIPGSFTDTANRTRTGLISWTLADENVFGKGGCISYKENKDADFVYISTEWMKSFTMGADTFMITRAKGFGRNPIIKVEINNTEKLYYYLPYTSSRYARSFNNMPTYFKSGIDLSYYTFYAGPNAENLTHITKENFVEILSKIMADKPEVVARIADKTFDYKHMNDLVTYYKTGQMPKNSK